MNRERRERLPRGRQEISVSPFPKTQIIIVGTAEYNGVKKKKRPLLVRRIYTTFGTEKKSIKVEVKIKQLSGINRLLNNELKEGTEQGSQSHVGKVGNITGSSTLTASGRGRGRGASLSTRLAVLALGVALLSGAGVLSADDLVLVLLVKVVTAEVTRALHVETTTDVFQIGHVEPTSKC